MNMRTSLQASLSRPKQQHSWQSCTACMHTFAIASCLCRLSFLSVLLAAAVAAPSSHRWTILSQLNGCECCLRRTKAISECYLDYAGCGANFCNCNNANPSCLVRSFATPRHASLPSLTLSQNGSLKINTGCAFPPEVLPSLWFQLLRCQGCDVADPGSNPSGKKLVFGLLGGLSRERNSCPRQCVYGTCPVSAHPRVQFGVYRVSASWRSELGEDTPGRYLAISWNSCKLLVLLVVHGTHYQLPNRTCKVLQNLAGFLFLLALFVSPVFFSGMYSAPSSDISCCPRRFVTSRKLAT